MGKPLVSAHGIVPGLNPALGAKIAPFIAGLSEGRCYQRTNWGLTASDQLDQHPTRQIPEIHLRQGYGDPVERGRDRDRTLGRRRKLQSIGVASEPGDQSNQSRVHTG